MNLYNSKTNLFGADVVDIDISEDGKITGLMIHKDGVYYELDVTFKSMR